MRGCWLAVIGAVLLSATGAGLAQGGGVNYDEAKRRYKAGEVAAQKGDWATAAKEYGVAYDITKDPILFYKIAVAHQQNDDCKSALVYYERYIEEAKPEKKFKQRAEGKIAECKTKLEADSSTGGAGDGSETGTDAGDGSAIDAGGGGTQVDDGPDTTLGGGGPPAFSDDEPSWKRTAAWASVGAVVTFATVGAVLGLSANSREEDIENLFDTAGEPERYQGSIKDRYDDLIDEGEKLEKFSYIAFGAAGVAAGAATVFFLLDAGSGSPAERPPGTATIAPRVGPNQIGVAADWSF